MGAKEKKVCQDEGECDQESSSDGHPEWERKERTRRRGWTEGSMWVTRKGLKNFQEEKGVGEGVSGKELRNYWVTQLSRSLRPGV